MFLLYTLIVLIEATNGTYLNPKGPKHRILAANSIFDFARERFTQDSNLIVATFIVEDNLTTPGYEIADETIKLLNNYDGWTVQSSNGSMLNFNSYSNCVIVNKTKICKRFFQPDVKTTFYIWIIDDLKQLDLLVVIKKTKSFKIRAGFIIHYVGVDDVDEKLINHTLYQFYEKGIHVTYMIIAANLTSFDVYQYNLYAKNAISCATTPEIRKLNSWTNGKFKTNTFKLWEKHDGLNCTINAVIMKTPPFVINTNYGIEILILTEISKKLNVSFSFNITEQAEDWGMKINGSWTGLLKEIDDKPFNMGIGCVTMTENRVTDFEFTMYYVMENMVWIVPAAARLPQWKVIINIFNFNLWIVLLITIALFGVMFYFLSKNTPQELNSLKMFGAAMVLSLQVMIGSSAKRQPQTRVVRILYLHVALFSILIVCLYQSGLIDALTMPAYEFQIDSEDAVFDSGIGIGGMAAYRDVFNVSNDPRAMRIFNSYEIYSKDNDTMYQWLLTVAKDRDTITILGEYYVRYLMSNRDAGITNPDLTSKIFIVNEILFTNQVQMVFSKGFPLKESINKVIKGLIVNGLITKWTDEYLNHYLKTDDSNQVEDHDHSNEAIVITIGHMEGAFALLIVGLVVGTIFFIIEVIIYKVGMSKQFKQLKMELLRKQKVQNRWKRVLKEPVRTRAIIKKMQQNRSKY